MDDCSTAVEAAGSRSYLALWWRWVTWLIAQSFGYAVGSGVGLSLTGHVARGILEMLTGIFGAFTFGLPIVLAFAARIALLAFFSQTTLKIWPTSLSGGICRAVILGIIVGVGGSVQHGLRLTNDGAV